MTEFKYKIDNKDFAVYFRHLGGSDLSGSLEAYIACGILPYMRAGETQLDSRGKISDRFISAINKIQDIYCSWDSSLVRTKISGSPSICRTVTNAQRVGTFFTGGVDSFYTFLKHRAEITDLIFVHGFDISLDDEVLRERTARKIQQVATHFEKNVVEIETNLRGFFNQFVDWGFLGHGAALATIGHLLSPAFQRIFIPATHTYSDLFPWGSHPVLDPLWSTEHLEFIHDGCEATRVEKVSLLSNYDIALKNLRVCWMNPNSSYNCGRCEKCLRTMINLHVSGALEDCTAFEQHLAIKDVLRINASDRNTRAFIKENLFFLEKRGMDIELTAALRKVLYPSIFRKLWLHLKKSVKNY